MTATASPPLEMLKGNDRLLTDKVPAALRSVHLTDSRPPTAHMARHCKEHVMNIPIRCMVLRAGGGSGD